MHDNKFQLRFGKVNKDLSNTNVFEHSGKFYSIAENHIPQEIDIFSLQTLGDWDINGTWHRPFNSHPKVFFFLKKKIPAEKAHICMSSSRKINTQLISISLC
jgi:hypothetical protein